MKINKLQGLKFLQALKFPTVDLIDTDVLNKNNQLLEKGISVRTSPKSDYRYNVYLPSIHNCKDIKEINEFMNKYNKKYNFIIHKTVKPQRIGSISRYGNNVQGENLSIELFEDFNKRKNEQVSNRIIVPIYGDRFFISEMKMDENNKEDFKIFSKLMSDIKEMPFRTYDAEFVVENNEILFTDLTVQDTNSRDFLKEIKKDQEMEER